LCAALLLAGGVLPARGQGGLFISQYYEGAGFDKWIELYNAGTSAINLSAQGYRLGTWNNASREDWKSGAAPTASVLLTGTVAAGSTYLLRHTNAVNPSYAVADQASASVINFNGDDSLVLYQGVFYTTAGIVDSLGLTANQLPDTSIVRKAATTVGKSATLDYDPSEWNGFTLASVTNAATGTTQRLGFHFIQTQTLVRYVSPGGSHAYPYTNWAMAATNIQAAISACNPEEIVLVTNGVYDAGGTVVLGALTNRVALTNDITVRSVNGPAVTIIKGQGPIGNAAVRCLYISAGILEGFTLTHGHTRSGTLGSDFYGGGVYAAGGKLVNCVLSGNVADFDGGGAYGGTLNNCTLRGNSAAFSGGGAYGARLNNCVVFDNVAGPYGGGTRFSTNHNCTIAFNACNSNGGGADASTLRNCIVYFNSAPTNANYYGSVLDRCCTTPELFGSTILTNDPRLVSPSRIAVDSPCLMFGRAINTSGVDVDGEPWQAFPAVGCDEVYAAALTGSLQVAILPETNAVLTNFAVRFQFEVAGKASSNTVDFGDGVRMSNRIRTDHAWTNPGSYEVELRAYNLSHPGGVSASVTIQVSSASACTGTLSVALNAQATWVAPGYSIFFTPFVEGCAVSNDLSFGDGVVFTNVVMTNHAWSATGLFPVVFRAYNPSDPEGVAVTALVQVVAADAFVTYAWTNAPSPSPPHTSWATAARTVQEAVDAQIVWGGLVIVTDGVYEAGARVAPGQTASNRLVITNHITVRSVNGPARTILTGQGPLGSNAVRCVYVSAGRLDGFTLTNGFAETGGGARIIDGELINCVLSGNTAHEAGGGVAGGALERCRLIGNAAKFGGGAFASDLNNCMVAANSAGNAGGGAHGGRHWQCTMAANSAGVEGGGVFYAQLTNCIVFHNTAPIGPNYSASLPFPATMEYSCSTPQPSGIGNIDADPLLVSASRLAVNSPCRNAGKPGSGAGVDLEGDAWNSTPSMGCDEVVAGSLTGALQVTLSAGATRVAAGGAVGFTSLIEGRAASNRLSFGDGFVLTNVFQVQHAWSATGRYPVVLRAFNLSHPGGVADTVVVHVVSAEENAVYVWTNSPSPTPPHTNWATAARTLQEGVDAQTLPGGWVIVTDGVYEAGGRLAAGNATSNRVVLTNHVVLRSVNGPAVTVIKGRTPLNTNAVRGVYLSAGRLEGFSLTNGFADVGGGVYAVNGSLSNCVISGNIAELYGGGSFGGRLYHCELVGNVATAASQVITRGGGAQGGRFFDCKLSGNRAAWGGGASGAELERCTLARNDAYVHFGGGAYESSLFNCLLVSNTVSYFGGGAAYSMLRSCTLSGNRATGNNPLDWSDNHAVEQSDLRNCVLYHHAEPELDTNSRLAYCSTEWLLAPGPGNIQGNPQFENPAAGDYRLKPGSPCIDRGVNEVWMYSAADRDGQARLVNGAVDMGAYELVFEATLKGFLQGPYDTNTHRMIPLLDLPTHAPYAADARRAAAIPAHAADWVHVEVRRQADAPPEYSRSAWLREDGVLVSDAGVPPVILETGTGTYYIVLHHRNHLAAMSAAPLAFTNRQISYDFTASADQNYGGSNAVIEVESNVWALIAGDTDGDGQVLPVDTNIWNTQALP
jgi:hypothetical protein